MSDDAAVSFVELILRGGTSTSGHGILGKSARETQQLRSEWMCRMMPRTANLIGVEWDGVKRLQGREPEK
jgi:hypothetical protein